MNQSHGGGAEFTRAGIVIVLVALLTGVAFVGGFVTGGAMAGNAAPPATTQAGLPPVTAAPGAGAQSQDPAAFQVFWDVRNLLKQEYYGELPDEQKLAYGAVKGVIGTLDDKFTAFIEPGAAKILREDMTGSFEGIGAVLHINQDNVLEVVRPYPNQPAAKAGMLTGDLVVKVDGKPTAGLSIDEAVHLIRGPANTPVTLTLARKGESDFFDLTITRAHIDIPLVEAKMLDNGVAYLSLSQFDQTASSQLGKQLSALLAQKPKGLVFDLRDNPGGLLSEAVNVSDLFLPEGVVVIERWKDGTVQTLRSKSGQAGEAIPMVVLVNGGSASASEIVAGALQDRGRARLIGDQTFGKGSVQKLHDLSDGSQLRVTIARWFTPNDHAIHGQGLTPDIPVPITPEEEKDGMDAQLDRAVQYILNGQ